MTRHRRPEWKRARIPCRPPAELIERVGMRLAYSGVVSSWQPAVVEEVVGPEESTSDRTAVLRATTPVMVPAVAWWQRLLRYLGWRRDNG